MIIGPEKDEEISVSTEPLEPSSLYSFTHTLKEIEKCPRRKVIKNFCFPDDVKIS